jgi:peptidoglycan/LPS O-acetylase OafA/YrhL
VTGWKAGPFNVAYREDIDRLRGLAVLAVVAFHFETPGVYGGYVGVDIFFVISGFLITQIVQRELRNGTFSFGQFYERRVRRLVPALYVMVFASIAPAFYFLLPTERHDFFKSIIAVVTFTSNILFWSQSGYFDRTALEKPLLHTWSLSVEEQFYLVFPALIFMLLRHRHVLRRSRTTAIVLAGALLTSFALGMWWLRNGGAASAFYLSPGRAWEFLIGSVLALDGFPMLRHRWQRHAALFGGYVLLLVPIFGLRSVSEFPGWNALAPCIGAALFIWSGTGAPASPEPHRLSPYRLARFFGTISYSMYLWHWPLFTFFRLLKDSLTLSGLDKQLLFAATFIVSALSWAFVEQPFRRKQILASRRLLFTGAVAASLGLALLAAFGFYGPAVSSDIARAEAALDAYNHFDQSAAYRGKCFRLTGDPIDIQECLTMSSQKPNVLLWGDSHAAHYYPGLAQLAQHRGFNLLQATQAGCVPTFHPHQQAKIWCQQFAAMTKPWFDTHRPDIAILSGDWMGDVFSSRFDSMITNIRETAAVLNARGTKVILLGPAVQFKTGLPDLIIRALQRDRQPLPVQDMVRPDIFAGDAKMKAALVDTAMFNYISVVDAVCPNKLCPALVDGNIPLTWDYGHLTSEGSDYVISLLPLTPLLPTQAY